MQKQNLRKFLKNNRSSIIRESLTPTNLQINSLITHKKILKRLARINIRTIPSGLQSKLSRMLLCLQVCPIWAPQELQPVNSQAHHLCLIEMKILIRIRSRHLSIHKIQLLPKQKALEEILFSLIREEHNKTTPLLLHMDLTTVLTTNRRLPQ